MPIIVEQNSPAVVLIDAPPYLQIPQETITVTLAPSITVIDGAAQGQRGPAGENADATFEWATQSFDLTEPQQEFVLNFAPRTGSITVYLNGLLEHFWTLDGTTLTLDDSALQGDTILVTYQKEI